MRNWMIALALLCVGGTVHATGAGPIETAYWNIVSKQDSQSAYGQLLACDKRLRQTGDGRQVQRLFQQAVNTNFKDATLEPAGESRVYLDRGDGAYCQVDVGIDTLQAKRGVNRNLAYNVTSICEISNGVGDFTTETKTLTSFTIYVNEANACNIK